MFFFSTHVFISVQKTVLRHYRLFVFKGLHISLVFLVIVGLTVFFSKCQYRNQFACIIVYQKNSSLFSFHMSFLQLSNTCLLLYFLFNSSVVLFFGVYNICLCFWAIFCNHCQLFSLPFLVSLNAFNF